MLYETADAVTRMCLLRNGDASARPHHHQLEGEELREHGPATTRTRPERTRRHGAHRLIGHGIASRYGKLRVILLHDTAEAVFPMYFTCGIFVCWMNRSCVAAIVDVDHR